MSAAVLRDLVGTRPLLLDFDGPICSIFAGLSAASASAALVDVLRFEGVAVSDSLAVESDPLAILRWTADACSPTITSVVEDALCDLEQQAVQSAAPTPFGNEVILAARAAGRPVAIVSNNSAGAIHDYLSTHHLARHIDNVVGRPYADPKKMKPHPKPILDAAFLLGSTPDNCLLVGDSLTDIEGARATGCRVIGYANRPSKMQLLRGADAVITTMADLLSSLADSTRIEPNHS